MSATLTTLASFSTDFLGGAGVNGGEPLGDLIADANGDLFGTTSVGGAGEGVGTVFEIVKTAGGYAATPTTLVSFHDGDDGAEPSAGLLADANGDLFGTTATGGANRFGTVFEIAKTPTGYASTPTTLVSFDESDGSLPDGSLIANFNGDLFGTTATGGANNDGTVFEIAKTDAGYASTPTVLASFNVTDGARPNGSLIGDFNGDLFGTTALGIGDFGSVFVVAKTPTGYDSTPITLAKFSGSGGEGSNPQAGLIADANGNLFGTTETGGSTAGNRVPIGTVFEIVKTAAGYASTPTTLASFYGQSEGQSPAGRLIADAAGDLFGTTSGTTADPDDINPSASTVFEIKKTAAGYASTPITVATFNFLNGSTPLAGLIADGDGNLFGTTSDGGPTQTEFGPNDVGTVFEVTDSGFVTAGSAAAQASDAILFQSAGGQAALWGMDGTNVIAGGTVSPNPGPSWKSIGTGDFNDDGLPDILWQNADGQASIWDMDGTNLIGGGAVTPNPGPSWRAVGTGDFNHDHLSDILWQNTSTGQASIWEMSGNTIAGGGAVSPNPGPAWKAIGTGDFNHDGDSDILWQNTSSGQVSIWEMNGNHLIGGGAVTPNPGPSWHAIGTGDFNDDGRSDILFQNVSSGQVSIWEMNGNHLIGGGALNANPGPSWHAIGTGDFNGDGHSDILLQNNSGQTSIWDMNGTSIIGGGPASANPGPSWRAIGLT
jgi:uncharacterized repeat protein (TIGR03803 family)